MGKRTEADLCAKFRDQLESGWVVHPEYAYGAEGWDMLLVLDKARDPTRVEARQDRWLVNRDQTPLEPGTQVGIEAKLRCNFTVLRQALPYEYRDIEEQPGPDFRAVLVPKPTTDFEHVANRLGLVVLTTDAGPRSYLAPVATRLERHLRDCRPWPHETRHALPEVVVDGPAGVPSPVQMTRWRIAAIRLCNRLKEQGFVTRSDFTELGLSPTAWYHHWLEKGEKVGYHYRWHRKPGFVPFDERHPKAAAELRRIDTESDLEAVRAGSAD